MQLRNQDAKGEDPAVVDKTRASVRDLHTRINVSMHTVKSVSKRIEALRDEELQPQLMELIQGYDHMISQLSTWNTGLSVWLNLPILGHLH